MSPLTAKDEATLRSTAPRRRMTMNNTQRYTELAVNRAFPKRLNSWPHFGGRGPMPREHHSWLVRSFDHDVSIMTWYFPQAMCLGVVNSGAM
jgi:hypothetical protein